MNSIIIQRLSLVLMAFTLLVIGPSSASADTLNLTGDSSLCPTCEGGTTGTYELAGLYWTVTTTQPTGSGFIDSFVRIQDSNDRVVDGMNTSGDLVNDEKPGPTFTHDVQFGDVGTVMLDLDSSNGTAKEEYYTFLLDINQEGGDPLLSLSGLQICTASSGGLGGYQNTCLGAGTDLQYDLDGDPSGTTTAEGAAGYGGSDDGGDPVNNVLLDYRLNSGSGSGDLLVYVPVTTLTGVTDDTYLYLWSQFGKPRDVADNNDGYEEWAFKNVGGGTGEEEPPFDVSAPEPASLILMGSGLIFGAAVLRRRARKTQKQTVA